MSLEEAFVWLKETQTIHNAQDLKLARTIECAKAWREARLKEFDLKIINELFLLIMAMARDEWGPDTQVDDFSAEGKLLIRNGLKEMEI